MAQIMIDVYDLILSLLKTCFIINAMGIEAYSIQL